MCSSYTKKATKRSSITDINNKPRKINFITAAGFEGLDILDPEAQAVLVIDMCAINTIFDWQTVKQMTGRCRNSKLAPVILYHPTCGYRQEMLLPLQQEYERLLSIHAELNKGQWESIIMIEKQHLIFIDGKWVLNPFSAAKVLHRKEIFENMQSLGKMSESLSKCGFIVKLCEYPYVIPNNLGKNVQFKKLIGMCIDGKDITGYQNALLAQRAIPLLGLDRIQKLDFKVKAVERALAAIQIEDYDERIETLMGLNVGMTYTHSQIRSRIESVNKILNTNFNIKHISTTLKEMGYLIYENNNGNNRSCTVIKSSQKNAVRGHQLYISHVTELHFFDLRCSLCTTSGPTSTWMEVRCVGSIPLFQPQLKKDQTLMSECYWKGRQYYRRCEDSFNVCDFLVLDVDNGKSISEFNNYMAENFGNALHYIYPTFSYTDEKPKYRVIIPLSHTLVFKEYTYDSVKKHESITAYKKLKACLFPEFQDPKCQLWYYAPFTIPQQFGNQEVRLNADSIAEWIEEIVIFNRAQFNLSAGNKKAIFTPEAEKLAIDSERKKLNKYSPEKIIQIINDAQKGNRDNTIFKMVNYLDYSSIDIVRAGIVDIEKIKIFNEKVRRRFGC